ncbi:MAG: flagellar assembly protein FliW [Proteobacteria bacterium]|nr:flagellar assembly protein FliW [Pseudomonadota bacterium]
MRFDTTRFGQINVKSEDIIIFPDGPLGFPDCTRFTFIDEDRAVPFRMLQSLDNPALAFVVVDPLIARNDYHFDVTREDLKLIKAESTENLLVYCIVTMSRNIHEVTVNLQGPLVINPVHRLGHQFVLVDTDYNTREKLIQNPEEAVSEEDTQQSVSATNKEELQKQAV